MNSFEEVISKFTPNDFIAIFAIIVGAISTLVGISLANHFETNREKRRKRQEFLDREISPFVGYITKLAGIDRTLREEITSSTDIEKLRNIHSTYIDLLFRFKEHLDRFVTEGKIRHLLSKNDEYNELIIALVETNAKFEYITNKVDFFSSENDNELYMPTHTTYEDYEKLSDLLEKIDDNFKIRI